MPTLRHGRKSYSVPPYTVQGPTLVLGSILQTRNRLTIRLVSHSIKIIKSEHKQEIDYTFVSSQIVLYSSKVNTNIQTIFVHDFLPSMNPLGMTLGVRSSYLCLNSWKRILLGKPCLQIRIPSSTPLHLS